MRALFLFAALFSGGILLLAACQGDAVQGPLAFETVASGHFSGIELEAPQVFMLESQVQWQEFWGRHTSITAPAPTVDFEQEMVIAVVDKLQPNGGYTLEITKVLPKDDRLLVLATRREPGPSCITSDVITQPFHIVRLPKSDLQLGLEVSAEQYSC
jgi:hypothetical protein